MKRFVLKHFAVGFCPCQVPIWGRTDGIWREVTDFARTARDLPTGPIGSVGVVAVDNETGLVVAWTPIDQMKAASRTLRERKEPYLTQQFQTFITTHTPAQR